MKKCDWVLLSSAVFLLFFVTTNLLSPKFQECVNPNTTAAGYYYDQNDADVLARFLGAQVPCAIRFIDRHNGFFALLAAIAVAVFTWRLVSLGGHADNHFRVSERAYVKMSHVSPPGIRFHGPTQGAGHILVQIRIKNFGRTPAHVTDVHVEGVILQPGQNLPDIPAYNLLNDREITRGFLVTDDKFFHNVDLGIPVADFNAIRNGTVQYFIIGYVDYRDRFGDRQRGTYARLYDPSADDLAEYGGDMEAYEARNNLAIAGPAAYNDDRIREPGEGTDWA